MGSPMGVTASSFWTISIRSDIQKGLGSIDFTLSHAFVATLHNLPTENCTSTFSQFLEGKMIRKGIRQGCHKGNTTSEFPMGACAWSARLSHRKVLSLASLLLHIEYYCSENHCHAIQHTSSMFYTNSLFNLLPTRGNRRAIIINATNKSIQIDRCNETVYEWKRLVSYLPSGHTLTLWKSLIFSGIPHSAEGLLKLHCLMTI